MKKKAAIYCRLSREDDALAENEWSESIQNQQKLLADYAKKNGFSIYCVYVDDNYSGLDNKRPAFCRLIEDARCGRFDTILSKNQSRFTRDLETAQKYLNELFPLWGIHFIGVCDGTDTNDPKGMKMRQINGLVNEWYSEDLSDNIRQILREKMNRGQFIGSFACYGYAKDPENPHHLIPDPPAASVVREIYDLYLGGLSLAKIASVLTKRQVPSPCFYKIQQGLLFQTPFLKKDENNLTTFGIPSGISSGISSNTSPKTNTDYKYKWSASSVRRILTNPIYTGTLIQGTIQKESVKSKKRIALSKEEWSIFPHAHPALISESAFLEVQNLLKKNRKKKSVTLCTRDA